MPGPAGINFRNIEIDAGTHMRPGDLVSVRVKNILPGGRMSLVWRGRTLTAKTHLFFKPGQVLTAKVESHDGGLRLRLVDSRLVRAFEASGGGEGRSVETLGSRALMSSALLRAGMPLPDDTELARRTALLERTKGRRLFMARLYAELFSKGVDSGADFLEAVGGMFDGRGGGRRGTNGDGGSPKQWPRPPEAGELSSESSDETSDKNPILALMSESGGRSGNWAFRRMKRRLDGCDVDLFWKIRSGSDPAVALTIRDGERLLEFLIEGSGTPRVTCYADENTHVGEEAWNKFRDRLALLNFIVSDTLLPTGDSDGFTAGAVDAARELEDRL